MQQTTKARSRRCGVRIPNAGLVEAQVLIVVEARIVASVVVDQVTIERGIDTDDPPAGEFGGAVDGRERREAAAEIKKDRLGRGSGPRIGGNVLVELAMPTRHGDWRVPPPPRAPAPFLRFG